MSPENASPSQMATIHPAREIASLKKPRTTLMTADSRMTSKMSQSIQIMTKLKSGFRILHDHAF